MCQLHAAVGGCFYRLFQSLHIKTAFQCYFKVVSEGHIRIAYKASLGAAVTDQ